MSKIEKKMVVTKTLNKQLLSKDNSMLKNDDFRQTESVNYSLKRNIIVEQVFFVLPAYNEEESLPNLLRRISDLKSNYNIKLNVIIVNDGSTDKTLQVVESSSIDLNLILVNHEKNMGLGQAVQTGIKEALSHASDNDILILMDADDTHDVTLMDQMIEKIESGADIVIASRFVNGGNDKSAPPFRRLLSRGASLVFKIFLPLNDIKDFTSGFRAYRANLLQRASRNWGETMVQEQGFACMVELLLKLRHWDPTIVEIPFLLRYDRKLGASKLKLFKTLLQYLKLAIRDRVSPAPRRK